MYGILPYPGAESGQGRVPAWVIALLMVGAKVLFNSAKMLKMGVLVVFMHDYGHQEALIDIITLVLCQGVPVGPSVAIWGCLWGGVRGCFFNPPYGLITADLKNGP